jgi:hypothetical protein
MVIITIVHHTTLSLSSAPAGERDEVWGVDNTPPHHVFGL